jgi:hypothetical protein
MMLPITVPPVASVLLAAAASRPSRTTINLARWWLRGTALLGFAGVGFRAYGISRNMAAGVIGRKTFLTVRHCQHHRVLPDWRFLVSPRCR